MKQKSRVTEIVLEITGLLKELKAEFRAACKNDKSLVEIKKTKKKRKYTKKKDL